MSDEMQGDGFDTTELFRLETTGSGVLAIRDAAPQFVLWGKTALDAYGAAMRALEFASGMSASGQDPKGLEAKPASPVGEAETPE